MRVLLRLSPALIVIAVAIVGPWFTPYRVDESAFTPYAERGGGAVLGADQLGRDVLSRLLAGGRELLVTSTLIAVIVTALAALLGAVAALRPAMGRFIERTADMLIMLPVVLGMLLIVLAWPGGGQLALVGAAVVLGLPYAVRVVGAATAPVVASGYVEVAVAQGERLWPLVWREVLPNLRTTLLTLLGLRFVEAVYVVTTAAFLEIGPQPPEANWALMVRENAAGILLNPWAVIAPSLAIGALAIGVNLTADALAPATVESSAAVATP
ncbi:MAG: ABC transporter permease subunit [Actinomycetota bacterium]|nr:ABC transporter permease subunit [Actinomycetota bacterium]